MNIEQEILNAFERGKGFGIAEGMKMMRLKELTDEEIQEIAHGFEAIGWMGETTYEFARAILRKVQEK
jgi:hypothetical protein